MCRGTIRIQDADFVGHNMHSVHGLYAFKGATYRTRVVPHTNCIQYKNVKPRYVFAAEKVIYGIHVFRPGS